MYPNFYMYDCQTNSFFVIIIMIFLAPDIIILLWLKTSFYVCFGWLDSFWNRCVLQAYFRKTWIITVIWNICPCHLYFLTISLAPKYQIRRVGIGIHIFRQVHLGWTPDRKFQCFHIFKFWLPDDRPAAWTDWQCTADCWSVQKVKFKSPLSLSSIIIHYQPLLSIIIHYHSLSLPLSISLSSMYL